MSSSTAAIIGAGTSLSYTSVGGSSYTALAELIDVQFPNSTVGDATATRYDSPSFWEEHLPTYKEPGEIDAEVHYLSTQAAALMTTIFGVVQGWQIKLPDNHTVTFNGYVNACGGPIPLKGTINQKIKIKVTGAPTYA